MLAQASPLRQLLAPGVVKGAQLELVVCSAALLAVLLVALGQTGFGSPSPAMDREMLLVFAAYALGFGAFVIGLTSLLRARAPSAVVPRVLLLVVIFFLSIGPWILAAISGAFSSGGGSPPELLLAAPSPFYVFVALEALSRPSPGSEVVASLAASVSYLALGLILLVIAGSKCKEIIDHHRRVLAEADRRLAQEDEDAALDRHLAAEAALSDLERPAGAEPEPGP
jgi:hypothetical protein